MAYYKQYVSSPDAYGRVDEASIMQVGDIYVIALRPPFTAPEYKTLRGAERWMERNGFHPVEDEAEAETEEQQPEAAVEEGVIDTLGYDGGSTVRLYHDFESGICFCDIIDEAGRLVAFGSDERGSAKRAANSAREFAGRTISREVMDCEEAWQRYGFGLNDGTYVRIEQANGFVWWAYAGDDADGFGVSLEASDGTQLSEDTYSDCCWAKAAAEAREDLDHMLADSADGMGDGSLFWYLRLYRADGTHRDVYEERNLSMAVLYFQSMQRGNDTLAIGFERVELRRHSCIVCKDGARVVDAADMSANIATEA